MHAHSWKQELHWGCFTGPHLNYKAALNLCPVLRCVFMLWQTIVIPSLYSSAPHVSDHQIGRHTKWGWKSGLGWCCRAQVRTYTRTHAHAHLLTYSSLVSQIGEQLKKVNISVGWYQGDSVQFALNAYMKTLTDPYSICCLKSITYAI